MEEIIHDKLTLAEMVLDMEYSFISNGHNGRNPFFYLLYNLYDNPAVFYYAVYCISFWGDRSRKNMWSVSIGIFFFLNSSFFETGANPINLAKFNVGLFLRYLNSLTISLD